MRLTDEMIQEDDKRFKRQDLLAEFNYCGKEVPNRKSITNDDIRFYAWLCRSAYTLLKEQEAVEPIYIENSYTHLPASYCPKCREPIDQYITGNPYRKTKYCHYCGQAVKWGE